MGEHRIRMHSAEYPEMSWAYLARLEGLIIFGRRPMTEAEVWVRPLIDVTGSDQYFRVSVQVNT